jgi:signal transduction histidine kinase
MRLGEWLRQPNVAAAPRSLPWTASLLYVAVLVAGTYDQVVGRCGGPAQLAGFVAVLGVLLALEVAERRRYGLRTPRRPGIVLLALRMGLFEVVGALDCSGSFGILYLLIPVWAYLLLGRTASYLLAACYLGVLVTKRSLLVPHWWTDQASVAGLMMFCIGLLFAVSMAAMAVEAQASRSRTEQLLTDLETAHLQLQTYTTAAADAAAAHERNRLARDIHDSLGHHLMVIAIQLEKATVFADRDPTVAGQALADAKDSARQALAEVRQSVAALRDNGGFNLATTLRAMTDRLDDGRCQIDLDVEGDQDGFDPATLLVLYRAAQEGLTNARRHSGSARVVVRVRLDDHAARLLVADEGCGFTPPAGTAPSQPRFGLRGMRERIELVGGALHVDSALGQCTRLTVTVPRGA